MPTPPPRSTSRSRPVSAEIGQVSNYYEEALEGRLAYEARLSGPCERELKECEAGAPPGGSRGPGDGDQAARRSVPRVQPS